MTEKPITVLFYGRPGAGKSLQADLLSRYVKEVARRPVLPFLWSPVRDEFMRGNTEVQQKLQENHKAGKLQPKFFSISVWGPILLRGVTEETHLIIDGIPRQEFEAEALDSAFDFFGREKVLVFNLVIGLEQARKRLQLRAVKEGRPDDASEQSIQHRQDWYESDTTKVLEMYKANTRYVIVDVDATEQIEDVEQFVKDATARLFGVAGDTLLEPTLRETDPRIIVSIGVPGAGKTTLLKPLAERHNLVYISRDDIRKEFFGNPILQKDKDRIWKEADRRVQTALAAGKSVVYDATFAEQKKRKDFVSYLASMGWKNITGLYIDTPTDIARERNRNREHVVSENEMDIHFIRPLEEHPPSLEDGFAELYTLKTSELLEAALG